MGDTRTDNRNAASLADVRVYLEWLREQDCFGVFGLGPDASLEDVRRSFRRLAKQWHPSVHALAEPALREAVSQIYLVINRAFETLSDPARAAAHRAGLATKGSVPPVRAAAGSVSAATATRKTPVPPAPPDDDRPSTLDRELKLGTALLRAFEFEPARRSFVRALAFAPHDQRVHALLLVVQAGEARARGDHIGAIKFYRDALAVDPECPAAHTGLDRLLAQRGKPGFFRRLFGSA
jgi:Flp pilus assembly protein TadD